MLLHKNNIVADQPTHSGNLINSFNIVCYLNGILYDIVSSKISVFVLVIAANIKYLVGDAYSSSKTL